MSSEPDGKGSEAINGYAVRERVDSKVDCLEDDSATKTLDSPDATDRLEKDESFRYDPETMDKLSEGLLKEYVDDLKRVRANLADLTKNQHLLIDTVQQENGRFSEVQEMYNIEDVFQRAKLYHAKLVKIKKDMADLYQRSKKLKVRSV
ncbi:unnamed protein product, partial [Ixodes pacificus]